MTDIKQLILQYIPEQQENEDIRSPEERYRHKLEEAFDKAFKKLKGIPLEEKSDLSIEDEWL